MSIKELKLSTESWNPGELLDKKADFCHVTITYNISGNRKDVDTHIDKIINEDDHLIKIPEVNTTLYWQNNFNITNEDENTINQNIKKVLKSKLEEIFIDYENKSYTKVVAFCQVGNLRGYLFEIDV